jgi:hypothetical protein
MQETACFIYDDAAELGVDPGDMPSREGAPEVAG